MLGDKLRRVFKHMDKAVQLAKYVVRHMTGGAGFTVQEDWNVSIAFTYFFDEVTQLGQREQEGRRVDTARHRGDDWRRSNPEFDEKLTYRGYDHLHGEG